MTWLSHRSLLVGDGCYVVYMRVLKLMYGVVVLYYLQSYVDPYHLMMKIYEICSVKSKVCTYLTPPLLSLHMHIWQHTYRNMI